MRFRVLPALVAVVLLAAGSVVPASPAWADTDLPFELHFPQDVSQTYFASTFGAPRSGGRYHRGNDLIAPKLTEVYAAADGVVIEMSINTLSGRQLTIQHVDGWTSHYVHLNNDNPGTDDGSADWSLTVAPGIEVGSRVVGGQLIAWVGDSGNAESTTSHTHFELRQNGVSIDPYPVLREAYERDLVAQELLADRIAEGLRQLIEQSLNFDYAID